MRNPSRAERIVYADREGREGSEAPRDPGGPRLVQTASCTPRSRKTTAERGVEGSGAAEAGHGFTRPEEGECHRRWAHVEPRAELGFRGFQSGLTCRGSGRQVGPPPALFGTPLPAPRPQVSRAQPHPEASGVVETAPAARRESLLRLQPSVIHGGRVGSDGGAMQGTQEGAGCELQRFGPPAALQPSQGQWRPRNWGDSGCGTPPPGSRASPATPG